MSSINIHLFGRFEVYAGGQMMDCFRSQKALQLLCFLILFHDQPHHREQVAEMFWGQRCTAESKKCLRKTLWQLQSSLEQLPGLGQEGLVRVESDWLQFNRQAEIWVDVLEFERVYASLSGFRGRELKPPGFQAARQAVELYRADLLEGCYQDWCIFKRERLKDMYFELVDKLMGCCEAHQDYEAGILYGRSLLALDWARERTHLRLMRLYHLAGDRTSALRQFATCRDALRREFNIEPGEELMQIYRQLTEDSPGSLASGSEPATGQPIYQPSMATVYASLARIKELLTLQAFIPSQILDEIKVIEAALPKR